MAGIFGFMNFNKEGKGVNPEDLERGPLPTFFGILGRKFWKLIPINLIYVIFSLPALVLSFFGSSYFVHAIFPGLDISIAEAALGTAKEADEALVLQVFEMTIIFFLFAMMLTGLALIIVGPVHAGIVYVLRNYSREEHSFIWSDFKEHALSNLKQALVSSLISLVVTVVFVVNLYFYRQTDFVSNSLLRSILITVIVLMYLIWCIMQMYLYPMMVTFRLTLKQMYKNSFFFAILKLPMNLLILFLSLLLMLIGPAIMMFANLGIAFLVSAFWYLFFAFAINILMVTFYAYRGLNKYMLSKIDQESANSDIGNDLTI